MGAPMQAIEEKTERLARLAADEGLAGSCSIRSPTSPGSQVVARTASMPVERMAVAAFS